MRALSPILALLLVLVAPNAGPQVPQVNQGGQAPAGLVATADSTLDAIRQRNVRFLSGVVDPMGIVLGIDADRIGRELFRQQLANRRGAYCVIFDASCVSGRADSSLRDVLCARPVALIVRGVDGAQPVTVAVVRSEDREDEVFSLVFRKLESRWVLSGIEYY